MEDDPAIATRARAAGAALKRRGWSAATAESCTGGGIAQALTTIGGSSEWFDRGFVTYSNDAKQELLDVSAATLAAHGAVSAETAAAMARGALAHASAEVAVSVTGVAGPTGGSAAKPVGTVWFGFAVRGGETHTRHRLFTGDRQAIRRQAVLFALDGLRTLAEGGQPAGSAEG